MKSLLLTSLVIFSATQVSLAQIKREQKVIVVKEEITNTIADSGQNETKIIKKEIKSNSEDGKTVITTKIKNGDKILVHTTSKELDSELEINGDSIVIDILNAIGQIELGDSLIKMYMFQDVADAENLIWINKEDDEGNWININDLKEIDEIQLFDHNRPFLGVILDDDGSLPNGIRVISVIENSAAALAGIEKEDIITELDGIEINELDDLVEQLHTKEIGEKIEVKVNRNGNTSTIQAILKCKADSEFNFGKSFQLNAPACCENAKEECLHHQRSYTAYMTRSRPKLGVFIEDLDAEMINDLKIKDGKGVLITKVLEETTAMKMGLKLNDVIIKLNDLPIVDVKSLHEALEEQDLGDEIAITYYRYGKLKTTKGLLYEFNQSFMDLDWSNED